MKFRVLLTTALLFTAVPVLPAQQTAQTKRDLRAEIERLRRENAALHAKIEKLQARPGQFLWLQILVALFSNSKPTASRTTKLSVRVPTQLPALDTPNFSGA